MLPADRQFDEERRARLRAVPFGGSLRAGDRTRLEPDAPAVFLDDGVGDREAQTGALAHFLRREERVEDAALLLDRNARTIVIDLEHGGAAIGIMRRAHDDGAPAIGANARLFGVDQQVEQHLLDLVAIGEHFRQTVRQGLDHLDVADFLLVGPQGKGFAHHLVQVDHRPCRLALAREGQQVADDAGGTLGFGEDDLESLPRLVVHATFGEPLRPRQDGGERIVELVRDAGNGLPERGHLLGLQQLVAAVARLVVELLALADVPDQGLDAKGGAIGRPARALRAGRQRRVALAVGRAGRDLHPDWRTIDTAHPEQQVGHTAFAIQPLDEQCACFGIDETGTVERLDVRFGRLRRVAEDRLQVGIGGDR